MKIRTVREQISFLKGEEPKKQSKIKTKPIDEGRVNRNEQLLVKIDDILYRYYFPSRYCPRCNVITKMYSESCDNKADPRPKRMGINTFLGLSSEDRVYCLSFMSKEDREQYNYLIHGLFR